MQLPRLEQRRVQLKLSFILLVSNLDFCLQAPLTFHNMSVNVRYNNSFEQAHLSYHIRLLLFFFFPTCYQFVEQVT